MMIMNINFGRFPSQNTYSSSMKSQKDIGFSGFYKCIQKRIKKSNDTNKVWIYLKVLTKKNNRHFILSYVEKSGDKLLFYIMDPNGKFITTYLSKSQIKYFGTRRKNPNDFFYNLSPYKNFSFLVCLHCLYSICILNLYKSKSLRRPHMAPLSVN